MAVLKKILAQLNKAYATTIMEVNGELHFLVATEDHAICKAWNAKTGQETTIWNGTGGTMNIVPVPGRKNQFIATRDFTSMVEAKESKIVLAQCDVNGAWTITPIMVIPYLHRFDIFELNGRLMFIGSSICEGKESKDDWSKPGTVYIGELSENLTKPFEIRQILEGVTKNHGFCRGQWNSRDAYFISGMEGVFVIYLPDRADGEWKSERIIDHEVSDIAVCDLDNDGIMELAAIEPFHGSRGLIYKYLNGKLTVIHEHECEFGHVVWGGKIMNKAAFIIGGRKGNRELNCFQVDEATGQIKHFTLDNTAGASNIAVINLPGMDVVLAANREIGEVAIYEITT